MRLDGRDPAAREALEHGCDIALHSGTKYLAGHDDALVGVLVCRHADDAARLLEFRSRTSPVPAADTAWLLLRRLPTLEVRSPGRRRPPPISRRDSNGTPRFRSFAIRDSEGLLSFDVADADAARRVETSTALIANMTSLGGVTTRIEARARWEGDRVPPGLLRLSVGLEDAHALWSDLEQALENA